MKFREAVRQATLQSMEHDPNVFLIGVGLIDPRAVWGTLAGALEQFGPDRVVEGPLAEHSLMGMCVGAAVQGLRPVYVHHRVDFTLLTMDQLYTHAAKWREMFGFQQTVPLVVRSVIGRGWGNGPQHTQSHHAIFSHIPGVKTVVPSNAYDAKGLYLASVEDDEPVVYLEHRWLHEDEDDVPEAYYTTPIGKAAIAKPGKDATVVAVGPMVGEALKAAQALHDEGIYVEVIDLRTTRPIDNETILSSVAKTGRLVVADADWGPCGVAGEIVARVAEHAWDCLRAQPTRVHWPESSVPSGWAMEKDFYPGAADIQAAVHKVFGGAPAAQHNIESTVKQFEGPF